MSTTDPPIRPPGKNEEIESMANDIKLKLVVKFNDMFDKLVPYDKQREIANHVINELAICESLLWIAKNEPDKFKEIMNENQG